jgi:hypothetical protein
MGIDTSVIDEDIHLSKLVSCLVEKTGDFLGFRNIAANGNCFPALSADLGDDLVSTALARGVVHYDRSALST